MVIWIILSKDRYLLLVFYCYLFKVCELSYEFLELAAVLKFVFSVFSTNNLGYIVSIHLLHFVSGYQLPLLFIPKLSPYAKEPRLTNSYEKYKK